MSCGRHSSYFKIGNMEHLLHDGHYNVFVLNLKLQLVKEVTYNNVVNVAQEIKRLPNARVFIVIAKPHFSAGKYSGVFKKYFGIVADDWKAKVYWCYCAVKRDGKMNNINYNAN